MERAKEKHERPNFSLKKCSGAVRHDQSLLFRDGWVVSSGRNGMGGVMCVSLK